VFPRHDGSKAIQPSYDGPFAVVRRNDKNFIIRIHGKNITVSIERVKVAYLFSESLTDTGEAQSTIQRRSQDNTPIIDRDQGEST